MVRLFVKHIALHIKLRVIIINSECISISVQLFYYKIFTFVKADFLPFSIKADFPFIKAEDVIESLETIRERFNTTLHD